MLELLKPFLSAEFIGKTVRTAIQSAMGGLITAGVMDGDQVATVSGAVGLIAATAWTAYAHYKKYATAPNATVGGFQ